MSELPGSWAMVSLGEIGTVGSSRRVRQEDWQTAGVPFYRAREIAVLSREGTVENELFISRELFERLSTEGLIPEAGDLMITGVGTIGVPYVVKKTDEFYFKDASVLIFKNRHGIVPEYLFYFFTSEGCRGQIHAGSKGTTVDTFTIVRANELPIPLPPLAEQKRIVAKIEELFSELEAGEESLRVARRQLGVYRQSLLKQAFEGHLTAKWRTQNPAQLESPAQLLARIQSARQTHYKQQLIEWETALNSWNSGGQQGKRPAKPRERKDVDGLTEEARSRLASIPSVWSPIAFGETLVKLTNGLVCTQHESPPGVPVSRIETISQSTVDFERVRYVRDADSETLKQYLLRAGDILFSHINSDTHLGKAAVFHSEKQLLHGMNLLLMRFASGIDSWFVFHYLNHLRWSGYFIGIAQHAVNQSSLNQGKIEAVPFPLCSLPEQQEIVRLLDEQFEVIERNEREIDGALRQSEALRQAILQKAFTGRLVPPSPADEPASELLARLRSDGEKEIVAEKRRAKKNEAMA